jgi:hypothetical protein
LHTPLISSLLKVSSPSAGRLRGATSPSIIMDSLPARPETDALGWRKGR